jgi:hypothetical protein
MKKSRLLVIGTVVLASAVIAGCSKVPQEQIDLANNAIQESQTAGAETYLPEVYYALQDSMRLAMETVEAEKSKFMKNYKASEEKIAVVITLAGELKNQTEAKKEELRSEIRATLDEVTALVDSSRTLILQAPKGKEGASALLAIGDELNTIEQTVNEATAMMEQGDYLTTLSTANAAKESATAILEELQGVIAKYKGVKVK